MTPDEREALAVQILTNPLFAQVFADLESRATEAMIFAETDADRLRHALRIREIRSFRQDCEAALRNTRPLRGAVA